MLPIGCIQINVLHLRRVRLKPKLNFVRFFRAPKMADLTDYTQNLELLRQAYTHFLEDLTARSEGKTSAYTPEQLVGMAAVVSTVGDRLKNLFEVLEIPTLPPQVETPPKPEVKRGFVPLPPRERKVPQQVGLSAADQAAVQANIEAGFKALREQQAKTEGTYSTDPELREAVDELLRLGKQQEIFDFMKANNIAGYANTSQVRPTSYSTFNELEVPLKTWITSDQLPALLQLLEPIRARQPTPPPTPRTAREAADQLLKVIRKEELVQFLIRNSLTTENMTTLRGYSKDALSTLLRSNVKEKNLPALVAEYDKVIAEKSRLPGREKKTSTEETEEKKYLGSIKVGGTATLTNRSKHYRSIPKGGGYEIETYNPTYRVTTVKSGGRTITLQELAPPPPLSGEGYPRPPEVWTWRGGYSWQPKGERSHYALMRTFTFE